MDSLTAKRCQSCVPGTLPADDETIKRLHSQIDPAWDLQPNHISRTFEFKNFRDAFGLATRIALLSEQQAHHPDLEIGWSYLKVRLTTHAAKGLTENDFIMAAKIDKLSV